MAVTLTWCMVDGTMERTTGDVDELTSMMARKPGLPFAEPTTVIVAEAPSGPNQALATRAAPPPPSAKLRTTSGQLLNGHRSCSGAARALKPMISPLPAGPAAVEKVKMYPSVVPTNASVRYRSPAMVVNDPNPRREGGKSTTARVEKAPPSTTAMRPGPVAEANKATASCAVANPPRAQSVEATNTPVDGVQTVRNSEPLSGLKRSSVPGAGAKDPASTLPVPGKKRAVPMSESSSSEPLSTGASAVRSKSEKQARRASPSAPNVIISCLLSCELSGRLEALQHGCANHGRCEGSRYSARGYRSSTWFPGRLRTRTSSFKPIMNISAN